MTPPPVEPRRSRSVGFIAVILGIATLVLARDLLIPIALAVLFTFLLHPIVRRLRRLGLPNAAAVVITVLLAMTFTLGIGVVVVGQAYQLTSQLPDYRENLRAKVRIFRTSETGVIAKLTGTIQDLKEELAAPNTTQPATQSAAAAPITAPAVPEMQTVKVLQEDPGATDVAVNLLGPLMPALTGASIVLLLLIFLLLQTEDIWDRLVWLAGIRKISLTTAATEEVASRITGYLRMQLIINVIYGFMVWLGLTIFGVPNAVLWGVLACVLRFAPYIGPWLTAVLPTLLAAAVFPGWGHAIGVGIMFICIELLTNMVLEPWLYATSSGVSTLGVVFAAVVWAWIWGPLGLVLAVPITVCLVVIGKHVPMLAMFHHLFGTDSGVPEVARLYQRLMVDDEAAAEVIICDRLKETSPTELCDSLLLPVLQELKRDLLAELIAPPHVSNALRSLESALSEEITDSDKPLLICIAGQNEVDYYAARLLVYAAKSEGVPAMALSSDLLVSEVVTKIQETGVTHAAIVQVAPVSSTHTRRLAKALGTRLADSTKLLVVEIDATQRPGSTAEGAAITSANTARQEYAFAAIVAKLKEQNTLKPSEKSSDSTVTRVQPSVA